MEISIQNKNEPNFVWSIMHRSTQFIVVTIKSILRRVTQLFVVNMSSEHHALLEHAWRVEQSIGSHARPRSRMPVSVLAARVEDKELFDTA